MKKRRQFYLFALVMLAVLAIVALSRTALAETVTDQVTSSGVTASVGSMAGRAAGDVSFLTGPNAGAPLDIVQSYINSHHADWGLTADDVADMIVTDQYTDAHNGVTHIYLRQRHQGIEVFNGNISTHVTSDGRIINLYSSFVSDLAGAVNATSPAITQAEAVMAAAAQLSLTISEQIGRASCRERV